MRPLFDQVFLNAVTELIEAAQLAPAAPWAVCVTGARQ